MSKNVTLHVDAYGKLEATVSVTKDGAVLVMSGWTAKMQIRAKKGSPVVLAEYTTSNYLTIVGSQGQILIDVPGSVTAALTVTSGVFDLYVIEPAPSSQPHRVMEGNVLISQSVTIPVP